MAKFCTNCGSELNPGAKFCVNCGQKVEQEQNPQAEAGAAAVAGVAAGAASSADISYKKSINDSPEQEGFAAANAQENVHTDANADGNPKVNPDPDEFKHTNAAGEADTDAYSAQAAPKAGKKFLNLGEGLNLLFKDSSADKEAVFKELFFTSKGRLNRKSYIYRSLFLSLVLCIVQGVLTFATNTIDALELLFAVVAFGFSLFSFVSNIMMDVRRLHDLDLSGWWMLLMLVPLVNIFFALYMLFFKGTDGPNQYGDDPLQS
ncbi:DUF805 domain-containing protein [Phascolarctobacterium succinatutens]|uniref:DUF805 domain-containing protein n=1 Tax=Phascolarctobacterium succinatutens TaxID=626940 RepID=UPI0026EA6AB4|nr:DUF805 domain-containing protein [Phascolarctobacterium succinatutens]